MWSLQIRRLVPKVVLLVLALTVSVIMIEIVVRLTLPQLYRTGPRGLFALDPPRRYRLAPGLHGTIEVVGEFSFNMSTNSLGMRGPEVGDKTPETLRILALGDSFTFGFGVELEETFIALAEEQLRAKISQGIEILNSGVPAYGLPDELAWLEHYGLPLEPDSVLVNICLANDLFNATEEEIDKDIYKGSQGADRRSLNAWLFRHSHSYRLASQATPVRSIFGLPEAWFITRSRKITQMHTDKPSDLVLKGRRENRAALARLAELARQHDFRLSAMLIPNHYHMVPALWERHLRFFGLDPADYDPDVPRRFFLDTLAELDIPVLDLLPLIQPKLNDGEQLYFKRDPHWTPAGNSFVADALSAFIIEEDLAGRGGPNT